MRRYVRLLLIGCMLAAPACGDDGGRGPGDGGGAPDAAADSGATDSGGDDAGTDAATADAGPQPCFHDDDCPSGEECEYGPGTCDDPGQCIDPSGGACGVMPDDQVCGCDGMTYERCFVPGVRVDHEGPCE